MGLDIRLVLFDLDGTLITSYMDEPDKDFHKWKIYPDVPKTLDSLRASRIRLGIITNQAGVAFGYVSEDEAHQKIAKAASLLGITNIWCCFAHPNAEPPYNDVSECLRRKPNGAMIKEAMSHFGFGSEQTLFVGDMESDQEAARHARVLYSSADSFFGRRAADMTWARQALPAA